MPENEEQEKSDGIMGFALFIGALLLAPEVLGLVILVVVYTLIWG